MDEVVTGPPEGEAETTGFMSAFDEHLRYAAALVLALPADLGDLVLELRRRLPRLGPASRQLPPHLTVLFLGEGDGRILAALQQGLLALAPVAVAVELGPAGVFTHARSVTNLHLTVRERGSLRDLHRRAIGVCAGRGWEPQTVYLRERYVPHISLFDRISVAPETAREAVWAVGTPAWTGELGDLRLMAEVLSGTMLD
jgi:2'-5' RNA ligase